MRPSPLLERVEVDLLGIIVLLRGVVILVGGGVALLLVLCLT